MRAQTRYFIFGAVLLFAVAQGINRPAITAAAVPKIEGSKNIPPPVQAVVNRSCKDCHSSETTWPWYSRIAPISWFIERDVREGRKRLDFSKWASRSKAPSLGEVEEICGAVSSADMPPAPYRFMHPNSKLTSEDVAVFCKWAEDLSAKDASSR